ncbi:MAG: hypothetical protein ACHQT6_09090 [Candidatus Acidiferrales bacterium]
MKPRRGEILRISRWATILTLVTIIVGGFGHRGFFKVEGQSKSYPKIQAINPPEDGFFTKVVSINGIPIKASRVVVDEALYAAYDRISMETAHLPMVVANLAAAGAELHIIGRDQVTTDLPEWRQDKHVPLDEYDGLTRDQRTRGMGGLVTSCGEENLLSLQKDRYRGRDICLHEFAHDIEEAGMPRSVRAMFDKQFELSKSKGLWLNSYAGSNPDEFFAELTMWYFGTHGDFGMSGPKPGNGPEGLKKYDPEAYKLFEDFYSGRIEIAKIEPRPRGADHEESQDSPSDSLVARAMVARLTSYKVGETPIAEFFKDAKMASPADAGTNGWYVAQQRRPIRRTLSRLPPAPRDTTSFESTSAIQKKAATGKIHPME